MKHTLFFHADRLEIPCKTGDIEIVRYRNIAYILYDKPYCVFVYTEVQETRKLCVRVSMAFIEEHLPQLFVRCNPATIINLDYLKKISYSENYLLMEDGKSFSLSRRKMSRFKEQKERCYHSLSTKYTG